MSNQTTLSNPFAPFNNWTDYYNNLTEYEKSQGDLHSLKHQINELQAEVNELRAQKDKRTMTKMRQFGSLTKGLNEYREHLNLIHTIMYKWYDAYMNGDIDTLITELLNDRVGFCNVDECDDCAKGLSLEG